MRLLMVGDQHCNLEWARHSFKIATRQKVDAIVQLGDFGYFPDQPKGKDYLLAIEKETPAPYYWIAGNHENWDALEHLSSGHPPGQMIPMGLNLNYIPTGTTWTWEDENFLAVGGAYSVDKKYRIPGKSWWPQELPTDEEYAALLTGEKIDILLSHDTITSVWPPPGFKSEWTDPPEATKNRQHLQEVVDDREPKLVVHGHYHHRYSVFSTQELLVEGLGCDGSESAFLVLDIKPDGHLLLNDDMETIVDDVPAH